MTTPVDLRSDTFTLPTPAMREAIARAEVGDDCFSEDPTVKALETRTAELLGKERALFFPSGIMANQAGILAAVEDRVAGGSRGEGGGGSGSLRAFRGVEVVAEARAHLIHYEEGSLAAHGGLMLRGIPAADGVLTPGELADGLRPPSSYHPETALLALENTHLDSGGRVMGPERTRLLTATGRDRGLAVHLDGARLWNAAVALGVDPATLAEPVDTVMVSLSKGLGAPVGSMLVGPARILERAWRIRRRLGGQMRQAGIVAAAGLYALEHHRDRLSLDHARARSLAEAVAGIGGFRAISPETNVVMIDVAGTGLEPERVLAALEARGVGLVAFGRTRVRAVLHMGVDDQGVETAIQAFGEVAREL